MFTIITVSGLWSFFSLLSLQWLKFPLPISSPSRSSKLLSVVSNNKPPLSLPPVRFFPRPPELGSFLITRDSLHIPPMLSTIAIRTHNKTICEYFELRPLFLFGRWLWELLFRLHIHHCVGVVCSRSVQAEDAVFPLSRRMAQVCDFGAHAIGVLLPFVRYRVRTPFPKAHYSWYLSVPNDSSRLACLDNRSAAG